MAWARIFNNYAHNVTLGATALEALTPKYTAEWIEERIADFVEVPDTDTHGALLQDMAHFDGVAWLNREPPSDDELQEMVDTNL